MMTQDEVKRELIKIEIEKEVKGLEESTKYCLVFINEFIAENEKIKVKMQSITNANDKNLLYRRYLQNCLSIYENRNFINNYQKQIIRYTQSEIVLTQEEIENMVNRGRMKESVSDLLYN